jgi:uncharacterized secreted protein with C-terminal beta-propeller domain
MRTWGLLLAGTLPLALAGCPWLQQSSAELGEAKLVPFSSAQELENYLKEQARASTSGGAFDGLWRFGQLFAPTAAADQLAGTDGDAAGGANAEDAESGEVQSFTTTNVQEAGVDESDVVKSDGTYFYIARDDTLSIVLATPTSEMTEIGRLDLDVHVSEMYLYGSKLILLAQRYQAYGGGWGMPEIAIWPPYYVGSDLILVEVDVSERAEPVVTKEVELDGSLVDSRLTNGRLILVLTIAPELPEDPTTTTINSMTLEEFMPKVRDSAGEQDMVTWQDCLHPESPDGYFMTAVLTIDADDIGTKLNSSAVVAGAGTIYASTEALYVTDTEYAPDNDYRETTAIHKFEFDDNGIAQYVASGSIPGRLLNQFSLGEYEGYLRAATHVSNPGFFGWFDVAVDVAAPGTAQDRQPPSDFSAVYVLKQDGAELGVTGSVENIAPNETLHSARFIGDHGFVVTFRKIDPLFVLDLTDPNDPQVVGELKVPGFSDYLHPIDDTHLIGVGKYTSPTDENFDWFQGVQVSLFDVSDWSNPTAVEQVTFGGRGSSSEVDSTHKGFTYDAESGRLAIPMRLFTVEDTPWEWGEPLFDGVVCLDVDPETGFTELGRIDAVPAELPGDYYFSDYGWRRAAFIGDTLYAISPAGVRAAPATDFASTTTVEFEE